MIYEILLYSVDIVWYLIAVDIASIITREMFNEYTYYSVNICLIKSTKNI